MCHRHAEQHLERVCLLMRLSLCLCVQLRYALAVSISKCNWERHAHGQPHDMQQRHAVAVCLLHA